MQTRPSLFGGSVLRAWRRNARVWGGCVEGGRARHVGLMGMSMWPMAAVQAVDFVVLVGRHLTLLHRPVMTKRRCDSRAVRTNACPLSTSGR